MRNNLSSVASLEGLPVLVLGQKLGHTLTFSLFAELGKVKITMSN